MRVDVRRLSIYKLMYSLKSFTGTSLVAQWLRIRLPMQETRVQALAQEDSHMLWSN